MRMEGGINGWECSSFPYAVAWLDLKPVIGIKKILLLAKVLEVV